jgi:hypothetical protein
MGANQAALQLGSTPLRRLASIPMQCGHGVDRRHHHRRGEHDHRRELPVGRGVQLRPRTRLRHQPDRQPGDDHRRGLRHPPRHHRRRRTTDRRRGQHRRDPALRGQQSGRHRVGGRPDRHRHRRDQRNRQPRQLALRDRRQLRHVDGHRHHHQWRRGHLPSGRLTWKSAPTATTSTSPTAAAPQHQ